MEVTGKVIVVTGAASGIGRGLCLRFFREGAKAIVAADVNEAGAKTVADEIRGEAVLCDVSREEDIIRLVKFAQDRYGRIDIFCSNAHRRGYFGVPVLERIKNNRFSLYCCYYDCHNIWETTGF